MNKRNLFVRITAIVLCAIMILSVFAVALNAFAAEITEVAAAIDVAGAEVAAFAVA